MKQAYQFFMENDDESKDVVIQEIADEMSMSDMWWWCLVQENQKLESELARYELHKQDLDDEVKVLANVGKEIPQVFYPSMFLWIVTRTGESIDSWSWEVQSYYRRY